MVLIGLVVSLLAGASEQIYPPDRLRVDRLPPSGTSGTPLATVHSATPIFSWALRHGRRGAAQTAFRVVVSRIRPGSPPSVVWDSGETVSSQSVGVLYGSNGQPADSGATVVVPLVSDADYAWTVEWRDDQQAWSAPSTPAGFSTGLLAPLNADWNGSAWVGGLTEADTRNQLRRTFALPSSNPSTAQVRRARCYVAAAGCHETHLNGVRLQNSDVDGAEDACLGPTVQFSSKLAYQAYDCTAALRAGGAENVLATTLGRCWFAMQDYGGLGYTTIGLRSLRVLITAVLGPIDGAPGATTSWRLGGDGTGWRQAGGPVVYDNLFLGVVLDGRNETMGWREAGFNDSSWDPVSVLHGPHARATTTAPPPPALLPLTATSPPLVTLPIPPIRRLAPRAPVFINITGPNVAILDFGTNMAGTCEVVVDDTSAAAPGDVMTLRHAEGLAPSGDLDQTWLTSGPERSAYIFRADGTREVYSERFTYFGFRYLEVTGFPGGVAPPADAVTCWFTHTDLERASAIDFLPAPATVSLDRRENSGNESAHPAALLASIQAAITQSALSNFHSHPTDCPSREKRGWTGDGGHAAETLMFNFGMGGAYAKWLADVDDASCPMHRVPNIAPGNFHGQAHGDCFGGSDPGWGAGFIDLMNWHHRYVGDRTTLARHYPAAAGYMAFLTSFVEGSNSSGGLLDMQNYGQSVRLGDWCAPSGDPLVPDDGHHVSNIIVGYFWIRQLESMANAARVLGNSTAADTYTAQAGVARATFGQRYFDPVHGMFRDPDWVPAWGPTVLQTEQALSIALCLDLQDGYGASPHPPTQIIPPPDVARAGSALAASVAAGLNAGMVGIKHVFSALAATGHGNVALAALTATSYPSFGYMLANGEGTLWERWEGGQRDLVHSSRNHIMLGSPGQFLFQHIAGIDVGVGGVAFDRVVVAPLAAAAADDSGLSGVDATVGSPRGEVSVSWRSLAVQPDLCGVALEADDQGQPLHLACSNNGSLNSIVFASYGTPVGTCVDPAALAVDPACNAPTSVAVATAECVGKSQCTLFANDTQFGGSDPCHGVKKRLVVAATCTHVCNTRLILNTTVPIGSNATIILPFQPPVTGNEPGNRTVEVTEGGHIIFRDGDFVPGAVVGVGSARMVENGIEITAGGGQYGFSLSLCDV